MRTKRVQAAGRVFRAVRDGVFFEIEHVKTCFVWQSSMRSMPAKIAVAIGIHQAALQFETLIAIASRCDRIEPPLLALWLARQHCRSH